MLRAGNRPARKLARSSDINHLRPVVAFEERLQLRGIDSLEHGADFKMLEYSKAAATPFASQVHQTWQR